MWQEKMTWRPVASRVQRITNAHAQRQERTSGQGWTSFKGWSSNSFLLTFGGLIEDDSNCWPAVKRKKLDRLLKAIFSHNLLFLQFLHYQSIDIDWEEIEREDVRGRLDSCHSVGQEKRFLSIIQHGSCLFINGAGWKKTSLPTG